MGNSITSSAAVANGIVYVGTINYGAYKGDVYGLNVTTGQMIWGYGTGNSVSSSPAIANGVVFIGSDDDYVYAINATTGSVIWNYLTNGAVESSPAIANGVVYVGSSDDNIYAFYTPSQPISTPTPTLHHLLLFTHSHSNPNCNSNRYPNDHSISNADGNTIAYLNCQPLHLHHNKLRHQLQLQKVHRLIKLPAKKRSILHLRAKPS